MATNVPKPAFTARGFVPPSELAILAGLQADFNTAFQTTLNFGTVTNPTPQGQLTASMAAIIGEAYSDFCLLANSTDPAYNFGRYQDAIGRIYFMERNPGGSTSVQCTCIGASGTVIDQGALAQDTAGNTYFAISGGTIPGSGSIVLEFQNQQVGPIPCPVGTLKIIFTTVPGWDSINNASDGVLGSDVESRSAFELRRQDSVQKNTVGFLQSILGALLDQNTTPGVLDAYVTDNDNSYPVAATPEAVIVGSISGTTLTVDAVSIGVVAVGQTVTGSQSGGIGVAAGTAITGNIDATHWTVNNSQTVAQTTLNLGGVVLGPNELYVAVIGGAQQDVARAIWSKKSPGCPYYSAGNTVVTIYDDGVQYPSPGVPYVVRYEVPPPLQFVCQVTIANGPGVPADVQTQVANAIVSAFAGGDGGPRAKIGSEVFASRFYAPVAALGSWANIVSLLLGSANEPSAEFTASIGASFTASVSGNVMTVSAVADGFLSIGDAVSATGVPSGTTIQALGTGTGGTGTYTLNNSFTSGSQAMTSASNVLHVTAIGAGALAVNQFVFGASVPDGSLITAQLSGSAGSTGEYRIASGQSRIASEAMTSIAGDKTAVQATIAQAPAIDALDVNVILIG